MRTILAALLSATLLSTSVASAPPLACRSLGKVEKKDVMLTPDGLVTFTADMDVNTDGTLESYGVDDLGRFIQVGSPPKSRVTTDHALNTICNGARIRQHKPDNSDPTVYSYKQCSALIAEFKRIRSANWAPTDGRYVEFFAIALKPGTEQRGKNRGTPCEKNGYYVSQTAKAMNPALDICDPEHWIDAQRIPAIVVPITLVAGSGVGLFDLVMVRKTGGTTWYPAIVGDTNDTLLGEGTLRLAQQVTGNTARPANYRALLAIQPSGSYDYVVFPGTRSLLTTRSNAMEPAIVTNATSLATRFNLATRPVLCP